MAAGHWLDGGPHGSVYGGRGCKRRGPRGVLEAVGLERSAGPRLLKAQPSPNYLACVLLKLVAIDRYLNTLSETNLDIMKLCLEPKLRRGRPRCSWAARLAAGSRLVWRRGRDPGPDPSHVPWDGDTANLKARAAQRSSYPFIHMRRATRMSPYNTAANWHDWGRGLGVVSVSNMPMFYLRGVRPPLPDATTRGHSDTLVT